MNGGLPSDVLYDVFAYYQQGEDDFHPLETLLLVSKYWADAALSYRALWGRYKIRLGHASTMEMWKTRLPLRLRRSGNSAPLEIDISTKMDGENDPRRNVKYYSEDCLGKGGDGRGFWPCRCNSGHDGLLIWVLDLLAGPNGQTRERWKTFKFYSEKYYTDFGPGSAGRGLFEALSFSTPSLVTLSLHKVSINSPTDFKPSLLPFSPRLQEVSFSSCCLPTRLPEMHDVRGLKISETSHWSTNLISLEQAKGVERLAIHNQEINLPLELPHLWHLTLTGWRLTSNIELITMPRLTHLAIDLGDTFLWRALTRCRTLPFVQLKQVEIRRGGNTYCVDYTELTGSVFEVLYLSTNLTSIVASPPFFSVLIKWTWCVRRAHEGLDVEKEDQFKPWTWQHSVSLLSLSGFTLGGISGNESSVELEKLARDWGLSSPDVSWETLLQILGHS